MLLQRLAADGLARYVDEVEQALADEGEPWTAFAGFMRAALDAGASSLTVRLAGAFTASDELNRQGARAGELTQRLLDRTKAAGELRGEVEVGDVSLLFEQLQAIKVGDAARTSELRHRYLDLMLRALRRPSGDLPGPAPTWQEISGRYSSARSR